MLVVVLLVPPLQAAHFRRLPSQLRAKAGVVANATGAVGARSTHVDGGVHVTTARLGSFDVVELDFPAGHRMRLEPEAGYLAVALTGTMEKTFTRTASRDQSSSSARRTAAASRRSAVTRLASSASARTA